MTRRAGLTAAQKRTLTVLEQVVESDRDEPGTAEPYDFAIGVDGQGRKFAVSVRAAAKPPGRPARQLSRRKSHRT